MKWLLLLAVPGAVVAALLVWRWREHHEFTRRFEAVRQKWDL